MSAGASGSAKAGGPRLERRRAKDQSRRAKTSIVAYYKAQRRGFRNSGELDAWLAAERAAQSGDSAAAQPEARGGSEASPQRKQRDDGPDGQ